MGATESRTNIPHQPVSKIEQKANTYINRITKLYNDYKNKTSFSKEEIEEFKKRIREEKENLAKKLKTEIEKRLQDKNVIKLLTENNNSFFTLNKTGTVNQVSVRKYANNISNSYKLRKLNELELKLQLLDSNKTHAELVNIMDKIIKSEKEEVDSAKAVTFGESVGVQTGVEKNVVSPNGVELEMKGQTGVEKNVVSPNGVELEMKGQTGNSISKNNKNKLKSRTAAFVGTVQGLSNRRRLLNDPVQSNAIYPSLLKEVEKLELKKLIKNGGLRNNVYERFKNMNFNKAKQRILALKVAKTNKGKNGINSPNE